MTTPLAHGLTTDRASKRRHAGVDGVADRTKSLGDLHFFTATELSAALDMSRALFFGFSPKAAAKRGDRGYGEVLLFAPESLPRVLTEKLHALRLQPGRRQRLAVEELVRLKQQQRRVPNILALFNQRLAPRWKASMTRRAMARYFQAVDSGRSQWEAIRAARAEFVRLGGIDRTERQIRRLAERIDNCGGPELAPIDVYNELKSVPHLRARTRPHHGESASADSRPVPTENGKAKPKGEGAQC